MPWNTEAYITGVSDTREVVIFPVQVRKRHIERTIWLSPKEFSHLLTDSESHSRQRHHGKHYGPVCVCTMCSLFSFTTQSMKSRTM